MRKFRIPSLRRLAALIPVGSMTLISTTLAVVVGWVLLLQYVDYEERRAIESAQHLNESLAHAFKEHVFSIIRDVDLHTSILAATAQTQGVKKVDLAEYQKRIETALPYVLDISVLDATGQLVASSLPSPKTYLEDRNFLKAHVENESRDLFIGAPVLNRNSGEWSIQMSRRLVAGNGTREGAVVVSIDPEYFGGFFGSAALGKNGAIALLRADGIVLARRAGREWVMGKNLGYTPGFRIMKEMGTGTRVSADDVDGTQRVMAFEALRQFPLMMYVGTPLEEVVAPVREMKRPIYIAAFGVTAALMLGSIAIVLMHRRQVKAALQLVDSEARYRILSELSPNAIFLADGGRIDYANAAAVAVFGARRKEELLGQRVVARVHPDCHESFAAYMRKIEAEETILPAMEFQFLRVDGTAFLGEVGAAFYRREGVVIREQFYIRDVTERRQVEQALRASEGNLRALFDAIPDIACLRDMEGKVIAANGAAARAFGLSVEELVGQCVWDLLPDNEMVAHRRERVQELLEGKAYSATFEDARDGKWLEHYYYPVLDDAGQASRVVAFVRDITDRKRAESDLQRFNAELEERIAARTQEVERVNKELEAFSYSVSHDLRAPLRAVSGFSELVLEENRDKLDADSVNHLERIVGGADRMARLIDDLMRLSRVSLQELRRQPIELGDLAAQVVESLRLSQPDRLVTVGIQSGMQIFGDPGLLRILLDNLIGNAWKFTSRVSGAHIEVGSTMGSMGNEERAYFVRDNGAGFDMRFANKLFGAFQRLHRQEDFDGTGIGLSIVQRVVRRHQGRIWAEGESGKGATFYFTLGGAAPGDQYTEGNGDLSADDTAGVAPRSPVSHIAAVPSAGRIRAA